MKKLITYIYNGGRYIFCKDGVHFACSLEQVRELKQWCEEILKDQDN